MSAMTPTHTGTGAVRPVRAGKDRPIIFSAPMVRALLDGRKTQTRRVLKPQPYPFECQGKPYWNVSGCVGGRICVSDADLLDLHRHRTGDRLWVKEAFRIGIDADAGDALDPYLNPDRFILYSPGSMRDQDYIVPTDYQPPRTAERKPYTHFPGTGDAWTELGTISPRFMPRWASRLTLIVEAVKVERLARISREDAIAEGATSRPRCYGCNDHDDGWSMDWSPVGEPSRWGSDNGALAERDIALSSPQLAFGSFINDLHDPRWNLKGDGIFGANPWVAAITFRAIPQNIDSLRDTPTPDEPTGASSSLMTEQPL